MQYIANADYFNALRIAYSYKCEELCVNFRFKNQKNTLYI